MARSHSRGSVRRPAACCCRRMSAAAGGMYAAACSVSPAASSCRRYDAEAKPPQGASPCCAPVRRTVRAVSGLFSRRMARRYSTASVLLGLASSTASAGPSSASTACWRRAAKVRPSSGTAASAAVKSSLSRQSAHRVSAAMSPLSEPNSSSVTTPVRVRASTPPRANRSAVDMAHTVGSSSTRSAPQATAISALASLSAAAKPPRWVKLPLMAQTTAEAPAARARAISQACPVWRGSYSQMMPVTDIVVLLGAILYGIAEHFSARLGYAENRSCVSRET